jgi:hypothetical protein
MPDKRDPFEPRYHYWGQHIIFLFFASGCFFLSRRLNWANTYFIENTVAGKYQTELSPAPFSSPTTGGGKAGAGGFSSFAGSPQGHEELMAGVKRGLSPFFSSPGRAGLL